MFSSILFSRVFVIIGAMLVITAVLAKKNRAYESSVEMWGTIIISFVLLFALMGFANVYPLNLILVAGFSGAIGWGMGPSIDYYRKTYLQKRKQKNLGFGSASTVDEAGESKWNEIVSLSMISTALAVLVSATVVFLVDFDFGILGLFLSVALLLLIIVSLLNAFFFKSALMNIIKCYFGALIFTLYLFYDFNRLEKMHASTEWDTAINISVSIYLDIINLFLYLLQIFAHSSD